MSDMMVRMNFVL